MELILFVPRDRDLAGAIEHSLAASGMVVRTIQDEGEVCRVLGGGHRGPLVILASGEEALRILAHRAPSPESTLVLVPPEQSGHMRSIAALGAFVEPDLEPRSFRIRNWASRLANSGTGATDPQLSMDRVPLAGILLDAEGRVIYLNRRAFELLGPGARGVDVLAADSEAWKIAVATALQAGVSEGEFRIRGGGRVFPALVRMGRLDTEPRVLAVIVDLSERRRAEARSMQTRQIDAIGTMASGMAHSFNDMLVGILGATALARSEAPPSAAVIDLLDSVEKAALRGRELVSQVLTFARSEVIEPVDLEPRSVLLDVAMLMRRSTPAHVTIETDIADDLPAVRGEKARLVHALLELAQNAVDALDDQGRVILRAGLASAIPEDEVALHVETGKPFIKLEVEDTGPGASRDSLDGNGAIGLGLIMARAAARAHGGDLRVWSEPGVGTRAAIFIPGVEGAGTVKSESYRDDISRYAGSETVLVVDDEPMVRTVSRRVLSRYGYRVIEADGGPAAIALLGEHGPDIRLILLDMVMPEMDGREFFWRVQQTHPGIPVLLTSGFSVEGRVDQLLNSGAAGFIKKPYELVELLRAVRAAIDGTREHPTPVPV